MLHRLLRAPVGAGLRRGLPLAGAALLACLLSSDARAQADLLLPELPGPRGQALLGQGGLSGGAPVAGRLGAAVAVLDLTGDGYDDLVVGAPELPTDPNSGVLDAAGRVYVVFGTPGGGLPDSPVDLQLAALTPGAGLVLRGGPGHRAGAALAAAGDVDGDGFPDLIIGAPGIDGPAGTDTGGAFVLFGGADLPSLGPSLALQGIVGSTRAIRLAGPAANAAAGSAVAGGVDVDGDGRSDVVLGAPLHSTNGRLANGTATIVYGSAINRAATQLNLAVQGAGTVTRVHGTADLQLLGSSVAGLGAFDPVLPGGGSDLLGGDDVAIGAPGTSPAGKLLAGAVYVLRGQTSGPLAADILASAFGGAAGLVYTGAAAGDQAGTFVASAGDLFGGNGFAELLVGAPFNDGPGKPDVGALYVLPGRLSGVDPSGLPLDTVGQPGVTALRIFGAVTKDGQRGLSAAPCGDFDHDGLPDLAVGFPNAASTVGQTVHLAAGIVHVLRGSVLDPVAVRTIDLGVAQASAVSMRLSGEGGGVEGGLALAAGDRNGDGNPDLLVGAPGGAGGAGLANSRTGRGHLLYGALSRVASYEPAVTHFEGAPIVFTIYNFDVTGPVNEVLVGGKVAPILEAIPGSPSSSGMLAVAPPVPDRPGSTVDMLVTTKLGSTFLPASLTYEALSITSGPTPSFVVPGTLVDFTGTGFSTPSDLTVSVGGVAATITHVNGINGTLQIEAPVGVPLDEPLDILFESSNGDALLPGAIVYDDFVVLSIVPDSAPQSAGVEAPPDTPGLTYFGEPAVQVTLTILDESGTVPPETTVYFGRDDLVFREAPRVSISATELVVTAPPIMVGQQDTPVHVRVVTNTEDLLLEDAFTYLGGDFREIFDGAQPAFGEEPPLVRLAGTYTPSGVFLVTLENNSPFTEFGAIFAGFSLFDPYADFYGGKLGPVPITYFIVPPIELVAFEEHHHHNLMPEGAQLFLHFVTQETKDGQTVWGFSPILEATVRIP